MPDGDDKAAAFAAATARHYGTASSEPSDAVTQRARELLQGPAVLHVGQGAAVPALRRENGGRGPGHAERRGKAQTRESSGALPLPLRRRGAVPALQLPPDFIVRDADGPLRRVRQRLRALPAGLRLRGALRLGLDGPRLGRGLVGGTETLAPRRPLREGGGSAAHVREGLGQEARLYSGLWTG